MSEQNEALRVEREVEGVGTVTYIPKEENPKLVSVLPDRECRCGCGQLLEGFATFPPSFSILTTKFCFESGSLDKALKATIKR